MTDDKSLQEFARIFRCAPEMAPTYVARIHERMGHEIPMASILAAMKKIAPKRLSMDTIIDRLTKMERAPARTRAPKAAGDDIAVEPGAGPASAVQTTPRAPRRPKSAAAPPKLSAMQQAANTLTANWERGRQHGLKPPQMTVDRFV